MYDSIKWLLFSAGSQDLSNLPSGDTHNVGIIGLKKYELDFTTTVQY